MINLNFFYEEEIFIRTNALQNIANNFRVEVMQSTFTIIENRQIII
jgi:hypothetical protein